MHPPRVLGVGVVLPPVAARVSSRAAAAAVSAVATVSRSVASQLSTEGRTSSRRPASPASCSAASSSPAPLRSAPTRLDIVAVSSARTAGSSRPSRAGDGGAAAVGTGSSRPSASPIRPAKTSPSSSEFDASRLAPCTPVQATSPQA